MKKKKKILVGWTPKSWYWYNIFRFNKENGSPNGICIPIIHRSPKIWKRLKRQFVKVRIIIEEIK